MQLRNKLFVVIVLIGINSHSAQEIVECNCKQIAQLAGRRADHSFIAQK